MVLTAVRAATRQPRGLTDERHRRLVYTISRVLSQHSSSPAGTQTNCRRHRCLAAEKFWLDEVKTEAKPSRTGSHSSGTRICHLRNPEAGNERFRRTRSFLGLMSVDAAGVTMKAISPCVVSMRSRTPRSFPSRKPFRRGNRRWPDALRRRIEREDRHAAIRILGGEKAGDIRSSRSDLRSPKYDWREMQRWGISESNLPRGSKVLFREPSIWKRYSWQMALIASVILVQGC